MRGSASIYGNFLNGIIGNGGGVAVSRFGTFTMWDSASVSNNTTNMGDFWGDGGGVVVVSDGIFTMRGNATVHGNNASGNGGGVSVTVVAGGLEAPVFIIRDNASVYGNNANGEGGGVFVQQGGSLTMQDTASVHGNTALTGSGGGIAAIPSTIIVTTITMRDNAVIHSNTAATDGGGVNFNGINGTFTMQNNASIHNNTASNRGGGVNSVGTFNMQDNAVIRNNTARIGGGVAISNRTFTMNGGSIHGNTASNDGGGVYSHLSGVFIKTGGIVTGFSSDSVNGNRTLNGRGHAVFHDVPIGNPAGGQFPFRNTTAGLNDHINTSTRRGLSRDGYAPFEQ